MKVTLEMKNIVYAEKIIIYFLFSFFFFIYPILLLRFFIYLFFLRTLIHLLLIR